MQRTPIGCEIHLHRLWLFNLWNFFHGLRRFNGFRFFDNLRRFYNGLGLRGRLTFLALPGFYNGRRFRLLNLFNFWLGRLGERLHNVRDFRGLHEELDSWTLLGGCPVKIHWKERHKEMNT